MGISLIKCWFSWNEDDLVILFKVSVFCCWSLWVLCVSALFETIQLQINWNLKRFGWETADLHKHGKMCASHKVSVSGMCHYLIVVAYHNKLSAWTRKYIYIIGWIWCQTASGIYCGVRGSNILRFIYAGFSFYWSNCRSWFSLEQNCRFIEDKLSSTTVDFIRSEGLPKNNTLYGEWQVHWACSEPAGV